MDGPGAYDDYFGYTLAIDKGTIVIGAHEGESSYGGAYVYVKDGSNWKLQQTLSDSSGHTYAHYGYSVDISGDTIVVGSYEGPYYGDSVAGTVLVYTRKNSVWTEQQRLGSGNGSYWAWYWKSSDEFGWSVSIENDTIVVGTPWYNYQVGNAAVFKFDGQNWYKEKWLLEEHGVSFGSYLGHSTAISGSTIVVGAIWANNNTGAAYIYSINAPEYQSIPESGSTLDLGKINIGESGSQQLRVSETGNTVEDTITYTVTGENASDFSVSPDIVTIPVGGGASIITVTSHPSGEGLRKATLTVTHSAWEGTATYPLTSEGKQATIANPTFETSPATGSTIGFGKVKVGENANQQLNINESGNTVADTVTFSVTGANASDFTVSPSTITIPVGGGASNVTITSKPGGIGTRSALLTVTHSAWEGTATYPLTSEGEQATIANPTFETSPATGSTIGFGKVKVGESTNQQLHINESGNTVADTVTFSITGANASDFSVSPSTITIPVGGGASNVTITSKPGGAGIRSALLTVTHSAWGGTATYPLTSEGEQPTTIQSPTFDSSPTAGSALNFGYVKVGRVTELPLSINVSGNTMADTMSFSISGTNESEFAVSTSQQTIPAGGGKFTVKVACKPRTVGTRTATLTVQHSGWSETATYPLSCEGKQDPSYDSTPKPSNTVSFGMVKVGTIDKHPLSIRFGNNYVVDTMSFTITGDMATDFTVSPNSMTVNPGGKSFSVMISCTPSSAGIRNATLTVSHSSWDPTHVYPLTCEGQ